MDNNCKLASSPKPSAPPTTVVTGTISTAAAPTTTTFIRPHPQQPPHQAQVQPRPLHQSRPQSQQHQQQHDETLQEHKINRDFSSQSAGPRTSSLSSPSQPPPPPTSKATTAATPHPLPASTQSQTTSQPKVTVTLPKHAASRLRELVQRRDIALLRLGITSVQFEDDQIIPLTLETTTTTTNSIQPKQQLQYQEQQSHSQQQPQHQEQQQPFAVYDDDEDEAVSEVEHQHGSFNIHQLSQLEFADPIELEMYDNENLLFPDYTLNLS